MTDPPDALHGLGAGGCYLTGRPSAVYDWPVLGVHRGRAAPSGKLPPGSSGALSPSLPPG